MKVILTEAQYRQLTEENLREFLYSFWDNQKRQGEDPSLDDIIFQVTDIRRDNRDDYSMIRPLWYRYNGGYDQKVLVCTLLGEAGGEKNPKRDMTAIANVLKNRAKKGHMKKTTMVAQALIPYQFSMWNNKSVESVFDKFKDHGQMLTALDIIQNINSIPDITNGALYYYANYVSPNWAKNTDTTIWKETAEIGKHIFGNVLPKRKKKK